MAAKTTGISRELLIHPGETIADILAERNISQAALATSTGVSPAFISNVIGGKKDISARFAMDLEYALGVPRSFWLNLQANYDAELLEVTEAETITDEERAARKELSEVIELLRAETVLPQEQSADQTILSLRNALRISNIANLGELVPLGSFRLAGDSAVNPLVMGAWLRLCQITSETIRVDGTYDKKNTGKLIADVRNVMMSVPSSELPEALRNAMGSHGIAFSVVRHFKGAPVQGYVMRTDDGFYQMTVTIRRAYEDIFWFTLFHEIGHIVNGDVDVVGRGFIDGVSDGKREKKADAFARDALLDPSAYRRFVSDGDYTYNAIRSFALEQNVKPCIVIGRLQKEKRIPWDRFSKYKTRFKWNNAVSKG